jgi:AhpD family alkylhydroperoxidase
MEKMLRKEFNLKREKGNKRVLDEDFLPYKRFFALDSRAYEQGAIPEKYKEMMGLSVSLSMRCNDCVSYHLEKCVELGATREELAECMNIALVIGGTIVIPHLRYAYEYLDEIFATKDDVD